jgi:Ruegeria phage DNA helicase
VTDARLANMKGSSNAQLTCAADQFCSNGALRSELHTTTLKLAVGKGKGLGRIANERWSVKKLIRKLSDPLEDTSISFAQYRALQKKAAKGNKEASDRLLRHKRMPGNYTTGVYSGNTRKVADLDGKSAVVLDIDHAKPDQIEAIRYGRTPVSRWAWFMHTSRSHYPERPKVRLIVWVNRLMTVDEAHAAHRLMATYLLDEPGESIEIVDVVSFRPNQTMFWPSISKGQEFFTEENVTSVLDVDEFLAEHMGWENLETLPYQEAEAARGVLDPNRKMEDPREKPNPIGAFCRAYDVQDVIEKWLDDIYIPGDSETETRYTYVPGTSSNGAVVYDDGLFLHSNHGSDPIDGSANAWDLLRVHKFGHLDKDSKTETSPSQLPSYKAMVKLAQSDGRVAAEEYAGFDAMLDELDGDDEEHEPESAGSDHESGSRSESNDSDDLADLIGEVDDDLADLTGEPEPEPEPKKGKKAEEKLDFSWTAKLAKKANGNIEPVVHNATLIFENDLRFTGRAGLNEHTGEVVALKQIRSKALNVRTSPVPAGHRGFRRWEDGDDIAVRRILSAPPEQGGYGVDFTRQNVEEAIYLVACSNSFHPVRDRLREAHKKYVESGRMTEGAVEQLPQTYLGCPDDEFHRQSSKFFLTALVARVFEPGIKFDCVAIIRGTQGGRKGEFWRTLAYGYFANLPSNFENVSKMVESMKGNVICELGEMAGLRRESAEIAKDFITKQEDQLRLAYARREGVYPRQSVLVGTSNLDDILHDPTGNRRFWIWVDQHSEDEPIDIDGLRDMRDYLIGEAVDEYLSMREEQPEGGLWLDLRTKEARAGRDKVADQYRKRTATEDIADLVSDWLEERHPAHEVMLDDDGMVLDEYADDQTPMIRNMVTGAMAHSELRNASEVSTFRDAGAPTYGRAMKRVAHLIDLGRCRRHGSNASWFCRLEDGPLWMPASASESDDDNLI